MKAYDLVQKKLEQYPEFRERSKRGKHLAKLALRKHRLEDKFNNEGITIEELSRIAILYDTYRHAWGDVTREREDLRGNDYDDGKKLSQEKQIEMGYEMGFNQKLIK